MKLLSDLDANDRELAKVGPTYLHIHVFAAGSSFTPDLSEASAFRCPANANATIQNPTNVPASGELAAFYALLQQDATGGRTWSFGSNYIPAGGTAPTEMSKSSRA